MKTLTLASCLATTWPEPDYILHPLQPGDVGIISGADGIGKSWVALIMAASVVYGQSIGGVFQTPAHSGPVLYLAGEDREADHGRRLACLGHYLNQEYRIEGGDELTLRALEGERMPLFALDRGQYLLTQAGEAFIKLISGYRLVIIDPLRMFHDLQENDGVGMDKFVRWLVTIAMRNQQAILCVHHASQGAILNSREDHHAGRGATDFPAGCRGAWTLRGMSQEEAKAAKLDEGARRDWRCLINSKSSHSRECSRVWLQRQDGGLLVRSNYTPGELVDERKARRGKLQSVKTGGDNDDF